MVSVFAGMVMVTVPLLITAAGEVKLPTSSVIVPVGAGAPFAPSRATVTDSGCPCETAGAAGLLWTGHAGVSQTA